MVADFVDFLIRNHALEEKYREYSIYGLTMAVEKMIVCTVLLGISLLLGKVPEGMVFIACFLALRQTTGGFHAETFLGCLIGSVITVVLVLEVLAKLADGHLFIMVSLFIISSVCILLFAPVNHPGLMLTLEEQRQYRYWSRVVLFVEIGLALTGCILQMKWQRYIMMAIIICAIFIIVAKLLRQEVRMDESSEERQHDA